MCVQLNREELFPLHLIDARMRKCQPTSHLYGGDLRDEGKTKVNFSMSRAQNDCFIEVFQSNIVSDSVGNGQNVLYIDMCAQITSVH